MDKLSRWKLSASACCANATAARCWRSSGVRLDNAVTLLLLLALMVALTMASAAVLTFAEEGDRVARGAKNKLDNRFEEGTG